MGEKDKYVGTIVGESTTQEFRMAVHPEATKEQDIVAVDSSLELAAEGTTNDIRVWAKVRNIERINPLFPAEAGHELAETKTAPLDTVLSFSREMVTAVCQVLGYEPLTGGTGKLDNLRYPPKPASQVYMPQSDDLRRIILGDLAGADKRGLDLATMSNRADIDVSVNGDAIVTRHLAILAMTGAGKSWTVRRIIEQLAEKNYPIVIFDPHGDYTNLDKVDALQDKVTRYYADFPIFDEDADTVAKVIDTLGYSLSDTMRALFGEVFAAAKIFNSNKDGNRAKRIRVLEQVIPEAVQYGHINDGGLWLIGHLASAVSKVIADKKGTPSDYAKALDAEIGAMNIMSRPGTDARTFEGIKRRSLSAAAALQIMSDMNRREEGAQPLPLDRKDLVQYGQISVVSLAGYTGDFQALVYSIIAKILLNARVQRTLDYPAFLVLEEAHKFAPGKAETDAEKRSVDITRQIAQEGRKFRLGMVMISQRPSRLDETALSQCNSQIIMRLFNPADQQFVRRTVESLSEDDLRILPNMGDGEAILSGQLTNFTVLAKIKEPKSRGEHEEDGNAFDELEKAHKDARQKPATQNQQPLIPNGSRRGT